MQSSRRNIRIFYFMEKSCYILEISDFNISNHSINFENCDVMMSISTRKSIVYETSPIYKYHSGVFFRGFFFDLVSWEITAGPFKLPTNQN